MTETARARGVLITGGASGIGRAVAEAHAALGDRVVVMDRGAPTEPLPTGITFIAGDVTRYADNASAVEAVLDVAGHLDHFVGNAGIHDGGMQLMDNSGEALECVLRGVLEVNVLGYVLGARASAEALRAAEGCMTFTLSDAAFVVAGNGAGVAYTASKHAGVGIVRYLASELAPHVRVNAVAPGGVITGLRARRPDGSHDQVFGDVAQIKAQIEAFNPLGVVLDRDELAELYLFLSSPQARGMTGEILRPDGGLSVRAGQQHTSSGSTTERSSS